MPRHLVIQLPQTKRIVKTLPGHTTGGGRFKIHCGGMDRPGKLNTKMPDVKVILGNKSHVHEIQSITIHTLKLVRKSASDALPVVGKNQGGCRESRMGHRQGEIDRTRNLGA